MARRFGAAVDGIVLGAGRSLQQDRIVALQSLYDGFAQQSGQVGVFAVGLLSPAPARIAEDIDVRGPERKALVLDAAFARAVGFVVDGARFGLGDAAHLP